jgi:hypothetical protein
MNGNVARTGRREIRRKLKLQNEKEIRHLKYVDENARKVLLNGYESCGL